MENEYLELEGFSRPGQYYRENELNDYRQHPIMPLPRTVLGYEEYRPTSQNTRNNSARNMVFQEMDDEDYCMPSSSNPVHSIHRNKNYNAGQTKLPKVREAHTGGPKSLAVDEDMIDHHAELIVNKMHQDPLLMESTPQSQELRRGALRDMPQSLTIKRCVKEKLASTIRTNSKQHRIGCFRMFKYSCSMFFSKTKLKFLDLTADLELWYGALKQIEGNFGSGVASYFKFLRRLFILNCLIAICSLSFMVIPQFLYNKIKTNNTLPFSFDNIFTGQGYFMNTVLFYGGYSSKSVSLSNLRYSMPDAYFFTTVLLYIFCFVLLSISMANSYRKSFIQTEGGLKNVFAEKVLCGWDFSVATEEATKLKQSSIYNEIRELLSEQRTEKPKISWKLAAQTLIIQFFMHILVFGILAILGYVMWTLMESSVKNSNLTIVTAIVVNLIMTILPFFFSFVIHYEDYKSARTVMLITLARTFLLGGVVIGVFVTYWLKNLNHKGCWETSLGQEVYRLILFDFIFSVILTALVDVSLFFFYKTFGKGYLEFDVARHSMHLIYNQTLLWIGLYFAPLLSFIVVVKLFITWYCRQFVALKLCRPSDKTWRAAQTHTWFIVMVFLSLMLFGGLFIYIIIYLNPSIECGPFTKYKFTYQLVTLEILNLEESSSTLRFILYVTKPGFVSLILLALGCIVYYVREKAITQRAEVKMYREMLHWQIRDKEFLLRRISEETRGKFRYRLQEGREVNPIKVMPGFIRPNTEHEDDFQEINFSYESGDYMEPNISNSYSSSRF